VDFLLVLIGFFIGVITAKALRAKRLKIGVLQGVGQYPPNFRVEGKVPTNHLNTDR